jgi:predicted DNA binding CopG/RHH family protein
LETPKAAYLYGKQAAQQIEFCSSGAAKRIILHFMQEETANTSAQPARDFAGLFAALAATRHSDLPKWTDEELPPDVTMLSYERALRTHARYKTSDIDDTGAVQNCEIQSARSTATNHPLRAKVSMSERNRKCASVTIRMSQAECEQLRERATEAGLTISAYLRSCTFEAEALRAQVKEALAEIRNTPASGAAIKQETEIQLAKANRRDEVQGVLTPASRLSWLRRIMPDLHPARNLVRA